MAWIIKQLIYAAIGAGTVLFFGCNNLTNQSHGPIVLGDPSTIVTERDSSRLKDMVTDLKPLPPPVEAEAEAPATSTPATTKTADTVKKQADTKDNKKAAIPPPPPQNTRGLNADFNIASFAMPNIEAKLAGNPNLERANGAVYTLLNGNIPGAIVRVSANITKVSQRYQTVVVLKNELGVLPLETLATTTDWEPLKGANNVYHATGLDERSLEAPEANRNAIRMAVQKAAHRRRMSRKKTEEWEESAHNARSVTQKPLSVTLRSVMWKIDGKDSNG